MHRLMLKFLVTLAVLLLILWLFVRLIEPQLAFIPASGETATPVEFGLTYEPLTVTTRDGERLQAWSIPHRDPRAVIVYFHGNGGNLSVWAPILAGIVQQGYSLLAFDYRGYGQSTGRPTERGLYLDVDAIIEQFGGRPRLHAPVIYWGRSLGVSMAAYAATRIAPDALILESGFPDARSLVRGSPALAVLAVFSSYRFPCVEFVNRLAAPLPVLVIHGDDDHVIPYAQGRALFDRIAGPKKFVTIPGGDHNDSAPRDPRIYWQAIDTLVADLSRGQPPGR
jgi:fermentation-respiration switch protein FrsA (DUF1100 family)